MNKNLLVILGVGGLAYYIWYMNKKTNEDIVVEDINDDVVDEVVKQATIKEKSKYTNAFKKQFNIKLPAVQASKEVKKKAFEMQDKRYARQMVRQLEKPEVFL
jgi:predicted negative regulator of RcsB-dependent stress response